MASGSESYASINRARRAGLAPTSARRRRATVSQFDPNGAPF